MSVVRFINEINRKLCLMRWMMADGFEVGDLMEC